MPAMSVLIVTHLRAPLLRRCLASVAAAAVRAPGLEITVWVAVNGADEESARTAREAGVRCLELGSRVSPARARNEALRTMRATGGVPAWILFLDDDAELPEDCLKKFLIVSAAYPEAAVIGGPNLTPPRSGWTQRAIGVALASRFATFLSVARYRLSGEARECGEEALMLCNLFVRSDELGEEPFPPGFVCAEENWYLESLARRGKKLIHAPELFVYHHRRESLVALSRQVFRYGVGRAQQIRKMPSSLKVAHVFPTLCLGYGVLTPALGLPVLPFLVYPVLAAFAAQRAQSKLRESWVVMILAIFVFPLIHVAYGCGVAAGLGWPDWKP